MSIGKRLAELFDERGVSYRPSANSLVMDCPSCGKEKHFYLSKTSGSSICYKCGYRDGWCGVVALLFGISFKDSKELVYGEGAGDDLGGMPGIEEPRQAPAPGLKPIMLGPDFVHLENSPRALGYLSSRGVTVEKAHKFGLKYHPSMDAVVFPVEQDGILYGWQARRIPPIPEGELRLISMPNMPKSELLINQDSMVRGGTVTVVEGPFDCINADIPGHPAVATMGKIVSPQQLYMIKSAEPSKIYIGLDHDAFSEVYEMADKLGLGVEVLRASPPEGKDFGACSEAEVARSLDSALRIDGPSMLEVHFDGPVERAISNNRGCD